MKRFNWILIGLLGLMMSTFAADRLAACNINTHLTVSSDGVNAIYETARREPGYAVFLDHALGADWNGNLDVVSDITKPAGTEYFNSGFDRQMTPTHFWTKARTEVRFYTVRSRVSGKTLQVKNDCLNPVNVRVPSVPVINKWLDTTENVNDVNVSLSIDLSQSQNNNQTLTATATTAPINIVVNNITQAPPLMMMGQQCPFIITHDATGMLSVGYVVNGTTKIYNNVSSNSKSNAVSGSSSNAVNNNSNTNVNNNTNNNANSNNNGNVVNVGNGSASGAGASSANAGGGKH